MRAKRMILALALLLLVAVPVIAGTYGSGTTVGGGSSPVEHQMCWQGFDGTALVDGGYFRTPAGNQKTFDNDWETVPQSAGPSAWDGVQSSRYFLMQFFPQPGSWQVIRGEAWGGEAWGGTIDNGDIVTAQLVEGAWEDDWDVITDVAGATIVFNDDSSVTAGDNVVYTGTRAAFDRWDIDPPIALAATTDWLTLRGDVTTLVDHSGYKVALACFTFQCTDCN